MTSDGKYAYVIAQIGATTTKASSPATLSKKEEYNANLDVVGEEGDMMEEVTADDEETITEPEKEKTTWMNMVVDVYEVENGLTLLKRVVIDKYQQVLFCCCIPLI